MVVACAASGGGLTVLVPAQGRCGNSYVYLWYFWWGRLAAGHKIIEKHRSEKWVDVYLVIGTRLLVGWRINDCDW